MFQGSRISAFHRLRADRRGAILPMAAVTTLILFMLAGLAIDVSLIISAKNRVRRAMDAAGIAIATYYRDNSAATQTEIEAFTIKWLEANYPEYKIGEYFDLTVKWGEGVADLSAKVRVDTLFMDLIGSTEIDANVPIRVISETRGLEVALALDNSGSMQGTEIRALRFAVTRFINVLYDNAAEPDSIRVSLVPFVAAVNIKSADELSNVDSLDGEDILMMDDNTDTEPPDVPYHGENFNPRTSHAFLYKQLATASGKPYWYDAWKGCVEARSIIYNGKELDLTDEPPDEDNPETLFVPYFWPDEPDNTTTEGGDADNSTVLITSDTSLPTSTGTGEMRAKNNYISDLLIDDTLTFEERIKSILKYTDSANAIDAVKKSDDSAPITKGPSKSCPKPIVPLTSDRDLLVSLTKHDSNNPDPYLTGWNEGGTNIPQGLVWAWRTLSEDPPFTQGAPYLDAEDNVNKQVEKIIVLFIDGGNGIVWEPNPYYSDYSAYGYVVPDGRLDPAGTNDLDTKLRKLCQNVRAPAGDTGREKIAIYAIGFNLPSSAPVVDILNECTGDPKKVFLASSDTELYLYFESLAKELTRLRVVY